MQPLAVLMLRGAGWLLARLPLPACVALARVLADLLFVCGFKRRVMLQNIAHVSAALGTDVDPVQIARRASRNAALTVVEMLRAFGGALDDADAALRFEPEALVEATARAPEGVVLVLAHSGNVDFSGVAWTRRYGKPTTAVVKPLRDRAFDALLTQMRARFGYGVISTKQPDAPAAMNAVVAGGGALVVLPDQNARHRGVVVDFLGQPASTFKGAAATILANPGCNVLLAVVTRIDDGPMLRCHVEKLDPAPYADIAALTGEINRRLGEVIRAHPESYLWQHRRWGRLSSES